MTEKTKNRPTLKLVSGGLKSEKPMAGKRSNDRTDLEKLSRAERREQQRRDLEKNGTLAEKKMLTYGGRVCKRDQRQLAVNMHAIIERYGITPSKLNWQGKSYESAEHFRTVFHRSQLKSENGPEKRLNAHTESWLELIKLISEYLAKQGVSVSGSLLLDELVSGTSFHPSKQSLDDFDKIHSILERAGDAISGEFDLIQHYTNSAAKRVEYYLLTGKLSEYKPYFGGFNEGHFHLSIGELFGSRYPWDALPDKSFSQLDVDEWRKVFEHLPAGVLFDIVDDIEKNCSNIVQIENVLGESVEWDAPEYFSRNVREYFDLSTSKELEDIWRKSPCNLDEVEWKILIDSRDDVSGGWLEMLKFYVDRYESLRDPLQTIVSEVRSNGILPQELVRYPHVFVGMDLCFYVEDSESRFIYRSGGTLSGLSSNDLNPKMVEQWIEEGAPENNWSTHYNFIVLVPDLEAHRLIPFVCNYTWGNDAWELEKERLDESDPRHLLKIGEDDLVILKTFKEIMVENAETIVSTLWKTAEKVKGVCPYIEFFNKRSSALDTLMSNVGARPRNLDKGE